MVNRFPFPWFFFLCLLRRIWILLFFMVFIQLWCLFLICILLQKLQIMIRQMLQYLCHTRLDKHYKIRPTKYLLLFTLVIQYCKFYILPHNIHFHYYSRDKISPIIFTFTIIFCRHVSNVTSRYNISLIIFTFTIIFCRHVSNVNHVTRSPP